MNSFIINGVKVSKEQYYRIKNRTPVPDDEIDYSDIPKITHEEFVRAIARKRAKQKNLKVAGWKKISAAKVVEIFLFDAVKIFL